MTFLHVTHYDKLLLLCQSFFSKNKSTNFVYEQWISYKKKRIFFLVEMKVIKNPEHFDTKTNEIVQQKDIYFLNDSEKTLSFNDIL